MTSKVYDVGVVGCGAMGAATVYAAQCAGLKAICWEKFDIPHTHGSSHGYSGKLVVAL